MLTIGLLGGMSWESSAEYYRVVNVAVRERLGGLRSAPCLLASVDFAPIAELQHAGRWDELERRLGAAAQDLERGGAELLLLCTNTMHRVADGVAARVAIPLLHIADPTASAALAAGARRVALLGTAFTMEDRFLVDRLEAHGLSVAVPGADDRDLVHRVIYDELCRGVVRESSRATLRDVIARLVVGGAEGVVLACTELELAVTDEDAPVPLFPSARLHALAGVDLAMTPKEGACPQ